MDTTELIGYLASGAIMLSFAFGNMKRLRAVNSVGCILFVLYGVFLGWKWPIIIPNTFIFILNMFHLFKGR